MKIGLAIKQIRKEKGFSQNEFAELCRISQTSISQIEKGHKRPNPSSLLKICEALGVTEGYLCVLSVEIEGIPENLPPEKKLIYELLFPQVVKMCKVLTS